jgi:FUN14 domain-containing protein 1
MFQSRFGTRAICKLLSRPDSRACNRGWRVARNVGVSSCLLAGIVTASPAHCDDGKARHRLSDLLSNPLDDLPGFTGALSIGGLSGFCAGFVLKKVGTATVFLFGSTFCLFQLAASAGYIEIKWDKVEDDMCTAIERLEQANAESKTPEDYINQIAPLLVKNGTGTGGGFAAGFMLGLKKG